MLFLRHPRGPLCKCERSPLCFNLLVLLLIYLHIYTCRPLCWCLALRGGHMPPVFSQAKPVNTSENPALASRPSVTSLVPLPHCCSLPSPRFLTESYSFPTGCFLSWRLITWSQLHSEIQLESSSTHHCIVTSLLQC